ncbi:flagellar basal body P-ring biosynthesis protein FlgA [Roseimaritima multifibrata]|uniref:Flagellar basal body P-ring biosynthesis protein FlgA n=1 Tax=Roseimaritima multifibrata TaxID=1930274 RepID=A0A517ML09_9BACT|nr:flagellar basal body P-ring formation chaperone FlgA [Roseimaritima multifibrata]QDS95578.1 flagellar basal body P-ring biosynthesis protein FlgA [Roseimaritima multifibrata]
MGVLLVWIGWCAIAHAQVSPHAAPQIWALQSLGQVSTESSLIRLRDVAKPIGTVPAEWESLGALVVGLLPPDGRSLTLERQRIADALSRRVGPTTAIRWSGPMSIAVEASVASTDLARQQNSAPVTPQSSVSAGTTTVAKPDVPSTLVANPRSAAKVPIQRTGFQQTTSLPLSSAITASVVVPPPTAEEPPLPLVATATRMLRRGQILSPADLVLAPLEKGDSTEGMVLDIASVVGQQLQDNVYQGRPLEKLNVGAPILIQRGDLLEICVVGGGIVVRTGGKAMEEGSHGRLIQVETSEPRRRLLARVVAPGKVEILTRPPQTPARFSP